MQTCEVARRAGCAEVSCVYMKTLPRNIFIMIEKVRMAGSTL